MDIISQLASSLGHQDEEPNLVLARKIANEEDTEAVTTLVNLLRDRRAAIQSDSIKVLYEIGSMCHHLIAPHLTTFVGLLGSRNNRMRWGAMTAIDGIATAYPDRVHTHLDALTEAARTGSVITNDHYVGILVKLTPLPGARPTTILRLFEQLRNCPPNQFPMYAEQAHSVIEPGERSAFAQLLTDRLADLPQESKRKRIEKILRKLQ